MSVAQYEIEKAKMIKFAKARILEANTALAMIQHNPNITPPFRHPLDPESWNLIGIYARKILHACKNDEWIDPEWLDAIQQECRAEGDDG